MVMQTLSVNGPLRPEDVTVARAVVSPYIIHTVFGVHDPVYLSVNEACCSPCKHGKWLTLRDVDLVRTVCISI